MFRVNAPSSTITANFAVISQHIFRPCKIRLYPHHLKRCAAMSKSSYLHMLSCSFTLLNYFQTNTNQPQKISNPHFRKPQLSNHHLNQSLTTTRPGQDQQQQKPPRATSQSKPCHQPRSSLGQRQAAAAAAASGHGIAILSLAPSRARKGAER